MRPTYADEAKWFFERSDLYKERATLRAEVEQARRTAEYWKAEHLAGSAVIDQLRAEVERYKAQVIEEAGKVISMADELAHLRRWEMEDSLDIREKYVLASDYDALAQRCRELEAVVDQRNAECDRLTGEVEQLRKDAARLQWLADNMRLMRGHKDTGHYQLPTLCDWVGSGRECCTLDDLRAAIDALPEAI